MYSVFRFQKVSENRIVRHVVTNAVIAEEPVRTAVRVSAHVIRAPGACTEITGALQR